MNRAIKYSHAVLFLCKERNVYTVLSPCKRAKTNYEIKGRRGPHFISIITHGSRSMTQMAKVVL